MIVDIASIAEKNVDEIIQNIVNDLNTVVFIDPE